MQPHMTFFAVHFYPFLIQHVFILYRLSLSFESLFLLLKLNIEFTIRTTEVFPRIKQIYKCYSIGFLMLWLLWKVTLSIRTHLTKRVES